MEAPVREGGESLKCHFFLSPQSWSLFSGEGEPLRTPAAASFPPSSLTQIPCPSVPLVHANDPVTPNS